MALFGSSFFLRKPSHPHPCLSSSLNSSTPQMKIHHLSWEESISPKRKDWINIFQRWHRYRQNEKEFSHGLHLCVLPWLLFPPSDGLGNKDESGKLTLFMRPSIVSGCVWAVIVNITIFKITLFPSLWPFFGTVSTIRSNVLSLCMRFANSCPSITHACPAVNIVPHLFQLAVSVTQPNALLQSIIYSWP